MVGRDEEKESNQEVLHRFATVCGEETEARVYYRRRRRDGVWMCGVFFHMVRPVLRVPMSQRSVVSNTKSRSRRQELLQELEHLLEH